MVDFSYNKPLKIIPNIQIRIHGIPYIVTFTFMNNKGGRSHILHVVGMPMAKKRKNNS
jgi:hypothetical protein